MSALAQLRTRLSGVLPTNSTSGITASILDDALAELAADIIGIESRTIAVTTSFGSTANGGPGFIRTAGYAAAGDKGEGLYQRLSGAPTLTTNPGYFQSADGAWWGLVANDALRIEQFGGKADFVSGGTYTDNVAPFNSAMAYISAIFNPGFPFFRSGPVIKFGYGQYYFSGPISPDRTVHIEGIGSGRGIGGWQTQFIVAAGQQFCILRGGSPGATMSSLRRFDVLCLGHGGQTTKHGIDIGSTFELYDIGVQNFGGHGIFISADTATQGSSFNANLSTVLRCWSDGNAKSGFYVQGGDANEMYFEACSATGNAEWGYEETGFLGNNYISCHAATNTIGPYSSQGSTARNLFIGCYSESDQPPSVINTPSIVVGGLHAAGITGTGFLIQGGSMTNFSVAQSATDVPILAIGFRQGNNSLIRIQSPPNVWRTNHAGGYPAGSTSLAVTGGTIPINAGDYISFQGDIGLGAANYYQVVTGTTGPGTITITPGLLRSVTDQNNFTVGLTASGLIDFRWDLDTDAWGYQHNNFGLGWGEYLTSDTTKITCGRSAPLAPNMNVFSRGLWIGDPINIYPDYARQIAFSTAAPTTGAWAQGDRVMNSAPIAGGTEGWVCVTAGTPGTWKTFGSIAA